MTCVTTQIWVPRIGCAARKFVSTNHAEALHTSGQCHTDSKKPNLNTFHHIYRTDPQLSQYSINLSAKWDAKHVFCYLDFCSHLKVNDPNCFHFPLKVLLSSKFMVKSTYRSTPKTAAKKKTIDKRQALSDSLARPQNWLPGNPQCTLTSLWMTSRRTDQPPNYLDRHKAKRLSP